MKHIIPFLILISFVSCAPQTFDGNLVKEITVKVGEKFRINLPEDHTNGYTWQLNNEYNSQAIEHQNTVWEGNTKGVYFYFKASKADTSTLHFLSRKYTNINLTKSIHVKIIP